MVSRTKKKSAKKKTAAKSPAKADPPATPESEPTTLKLEPVKQRCVTIRIKSKSPMIQHKWSEKAKEMMRQKHAGKKTRNYDVRDPKKEGEEAAYRTYDGRYGIPLTALKASLIGAAHKDIGIEKTLVKKALFIPATDPNGIIPIECDEPVIQEDHVRVGAGSADLRYRPYFMHWAAEVTFEVDCGLLQTQGLLALIDRAGFGVGMREWRPEKGGDYGRYMVGAAAGITEEDI